MAIETLIKENTDEMIALLIVIAYVISTFVSIDFPTEPLMIILGYYFGRKVV